MPTIDRVAIIDVVTLTVAGSVAVAGAPRDLDRRQLASDSRLHISTDDGLRIYDWTTGVPSPPLAVGAGSLRVLEAGAAYFLHPPDRVFVAAWPATGGWQEAHNSPGGTGAATRCGVGDGEVGNPPYNTQTYFLVANTSAEPATVRVTLMPDGAAAVARTFTVPAHSRFSVPVASEFPEVMGKGFGALIESLGGVPVPIVVERAMYSDAGGIIWAAGSDALGTPIP